MRFFNGYIIAREQAFGLSTAVPAATPVAPSPSGGIPFPPRRLRHRRKPLSSTVLASITDYLEYKVEVEGRS